MTHRSVCKVAYVLVAIGKDVLATPVTLQQQISLGFHPALRPTMAHRVTLVHAFMVVSTRECLASRPCCLILNPSATKYVAVHVYVAPFSVPHPLRQASRR